MEVAFVPTDGGITIAEFDIGDTEVADILEKISPTTTGTTRRAKLDGQHAAGRADIVVAWYQTVMISLDKFTTRTHHELSLADLISGSGRGELVPGVPALARFLGDTLVAALQRDEYKAEWREQ